MRYLTSVGLLLAWALWLGGLAMVLTTAPMYFATDRELAPRAASLMFLHFERFQIVVGACGVILAAVLVFRSTGRASKLFLAGLLLTAVLAGISSRVITPRIEHMRQAGQTQVPEFTRLHGISMSLLLGELIVLAGCGLALPAVVGGSRQPRG